MADITVKELKERMDRGEDLVVVDVREPAEYERGHITPLLIPVGELVTRMDELEPYRNRELIIHCRSGKRSAAAVAVLQQNGFSNPRNLAGGMLAWKQEIDPAFNVE